MVLTAALFLAALLYSSVGHGGGSAYIALFHISGMDAYVASSTALVLNLAVSGTAFFNYRLGGYPFRPLPEPSSASSPVS